MPSKSIYVAAKGKFSFFFMAEMWYIYPIYKVLFSLCIQVLIDICFFHIFAIINNAAMNIGMYVSFLIGGGVFFVGGDIYQGEEFLVHVVVLFLVFWETFILCSTVTVPIYILTDSVQGFSFLHIFANIFYLYSFLMIDILTNLRWYLMVVLICISLID